MLVKEGTNRVKKVALGSGLAMTALSNMMPARTGSKSSPEVRPDTTTSLVRPRPSWGRKPWLARVFIMGQGPRTGIGEWEDMVAKEIRRTVIGSGRVPGRNLPWLGIFLSNRDGRKGED
jgi:hypothetical protein